jgi:hypothetical protein
VVSGTTSVVPPEGASAGAAGGLADAEDAAPAELPAAVDTVSLTGELLVTCSAGGGGAGTVSGGGLAADSPEVEEGASPDGTTAVAGAAVSAAVSATGAGVEASREVPAVVSAGVATVLVTSLIDAPWSIAAQHGRVMVVRADFPDRWVPHPDRRRNSGIDLDFAG